MNTYYVVDEVDEKPEAVQGMTPRYTDPLNALKELQEMSESERGKWCIYKCQYTPPVRVEVVVVKEK